MRAAMRAVTIESGGEHLLGVLYLPGGPGPHPVVVLMHGFPGTESNADLAQALRAGGYACLLFHYRGSWGVAGVWSWANALADAARVARAVRTGPFVSEHGVDPRRVALFGHSFGGFAALMTAADDAEVSAVISTSGFDFGAVTGSPGYDRDSYVKAFEAELRPLRGATGEDLVAEMEAAGPRWSLASLAPRLAGRPVLLIGTALDDVTPAEVHHRPLVRAYAGGVLEHHEWATDHALSDHRHRLSDCVRDFLDRRLQDG